MKSFEEGRGGVEGKGENFLERFSLPPHKNSYFSK
jgi:hypothetical protein